jgi:hypothetical protein
MVGYYLSQNAILPASDQVHPVTFVGAPAKDVSDEQIAVNVLSMIGNKLS